MDNKEQLDKLEEDQKSEVIVNFGNSSYGKIELNINFKENLSNEPKLL